MHTLNFKALGHLRHTHGMWVWALTVLVISLPLIGEDVGTLIASLALILLLIALSLIDSISHRLPNALTAALALAGGIWVFHQPSDQHTTYLMGGIAGYTVFWLVSRTHLEIRGRHGLGLGDAKLLAAGGLWLGWPSLPGIILIAALSALSWAALSWATLSGRAYKGMALPFGPYLALGIWWSWCFGPLRMGGLS